MRFLRKNNKSIILSETLSYDNKSQRPRIKKLLKKEQLNFCAYSERHIKHTDEVHIEHFDGRIKETKKDSYFNWYAVLSWLNSHKPKKLDERFLPLLSPFTKNLHERIQYQNGIFSPVKNTDIEAKNLIKYLGFNKYELTLDRKKHINRIKELRALCGDDQKLFIEQLSKHKENLSFITALEIELNLNLSHLL